MMPFSYVMIHDILINYSLSLRQGNYLKEAFTLEFFSGKSI